MSGAVPPIGQLGLRRQPLDGQVDEQRERREHARGCPATHPGRRWRSPTVTDRRVGTECEPRQEQQVDDQQQRDPPMIQSSLEDARRPASTRFATLRASRTPLLEAIQPRRPCASASRSSSGRRRRYRRDPAAPETSSNATSPSSPSSSRLMPTSITTAPGLTYSARSAPARRRLRSARRPASRRRRGRACASGTS